jgi:hypothetical protein
MLGFLFGPAYGGGYSRSMGSTTPSTPPGVENLTTRLDQLELACAGLWRLLREKHGYTDEELIAAVNEADAADGRIDGRFHPARTVCPKCNRPSLTRSRGKCLWCGAEMPASPL